MPVPGSITNLFFNNYGASNEQNLLEDLITESISIYGIDFHYLPKTYNNIDDLYLQDDIPSFNSAIQICLYVRSYDGFSGEGSFMSKFGLEIRDQITFTISKRIFENEIGERFELARPREGDLIYYPLNKKLFEIKYVENKPVHYPLGILPTYDLFCELYEYSNERFNTGIPEIDDITEKLSTNLYDYAMKSDAGAPLKTDQGHLILSDKYNLDVIDPIENNSEIVNEANGIIDFSESNPFSENWPENL